MKNIIPIIMSAILLMFAFIQCNKVEQPVVYTPPAVDTIYYTESNEDFPNPERGFYRYAETYAKFYELLTVNQLKAWRGLELADDGNYKIYSTIVYRGITLEGFTNKPLTDELLENIKKDFSTAREAGVKLILRFSYNINPKSGTCPEGFICPPYKDASKEMVLNHIAQLKPLLQENADIICCMQMGFVGMWGENYYSDFFGDPSSNGRGKLTDKNWQDKNEVLKALLDGLPADRMVQVRTPQMKQRYVYGVNAATNSAALTGAEAFTETDKARIGFHNDCFLSSPDDYGTYDDYGNSSSPHISAYTVLHNYAMQDGKYLPVGGETCDDTYSPENDCENTGKAQTEMRNMHYSFLNCAYNNDVNNDWQTGGCMDEIKMNLGYRFVLRNAVFPSSPVEAGKLFSFNITVDNAGYASPFNPHPLKIIFRNKQSAEEFSFDTDINVRKWYSGINAEKITILTKAVMPKGDYDLFLFLPDKYSSIAARPEYAIRLANENVWEESTGYNSLGHSVSVK